MAKPLFEYKLDVLLNEWRLVQAQISQFDTVALSIRGWAVTVFGGILAVSASIKQAGLVPFAALPIMLFWLIDALFKSFQSRVIGRSEEIESYLRSDEFRKDAAQQTSFGFVSPRLADAFKLPIAVRLQDLVRALFYANVMLTYAALLIACVMSYYVLSQIHFAK